MRPIQPFLTLENHTPGHQRLQSVPHALGNVDTINTIFVTKHDRINYRTIVVICCRAKDSSFSRMPVYRNSRPRFYGIQHTIAFLIMTPMEVIVHPQTWRILRLYNHNRSLSNKRKRTPTPSRQPPSRAVRRGDRATARNENRSSGNQPPALRANTTILISRNLLLLSMYHCPLLFPWI